MRTGLHALVRTVGAVGAQLVGVGDASMAMECDGGSTDSDGGYVWLVSELVSPIYHLAHCTASIGALFQPARCAATHVSLVASVPRGCEQNLDACASASAAACGSCGMGPGLTQSTSPR